MHSLPGDLFVNEKTEDGRQRIGIIGTPERWETPIQPTYDEVYAIAYFAMSRHAHRIEENTLNIFYDWAAWQQQQESDKLKAFATWMQQREAWSRDAFGLTKDRGPIGPAKHLLKEVAEYIESGSLEEIADIFFLAFDITRRAGYTFGELLAALEHKLEINRQREWPKGNPNEPIEHNRAKDAASVHGSDSGKPG